MMIGTLVVFPSVQTSAQEVPIFDAHVHYNQPDWSVHSPAAILKLFDLARVQWAMVSSTPDDGTIKLFEKAPTRIVPIFRPYRTRSDMGSWMKDSTILSYVEKQLEKGIDRGIGEFHLSADQTNTAVVRGFVQFAIRRGEISLCAIETDSWLEAIPGSPRVGRFLWKSTEASVPGSMRFHEMSRKNSLSRMVFVWLANPE